MVKEKIPLKIVVAGILRNVQREILITERPLGKFMEGYWEFPGGKVEEGESPEEALIREIKEELGLLLHKKDLSPYGFISYDYHDFHVLMPAYLIENWQGDIEKQGCEGQALCWINPFELENFKILPADFPLIQRLKEDEIKRVSFKV